MSSNYGGERGGLTNATLGRVELTGPRALQDFLFVFISNKWAPMLSDE